MVKTYGKQWKKIASHMNKRNANDIKNRWNATNYYRYLYLNKNLCAVLGLSYSSDIYNAFS